MATTEAVRERRDLILLCAKEGKTTKTIASELGLKQKTVQNVLYNARAAGLLPKPTARPTKARVAIDYNGEVIRPPVFAKTATAKIVTCPHCHQIIVCE